MNLHTPSEKLAKKHRSGDRKDHGSVLVKILCVLAAFILWLYVMSVESPEHEEIFSNITVVLENEASLTEKGLAIYSGYGNMIDITLAGKKSVLSKIDPGDIVATVDLGGKSISGRYDCEITVDVPAGCKLVSTSQKSISVYIDNSDRITIDLSVKVENLTLPDGCELGSIELPYDKVDIQGAKRTIDRVASAVATFDLSGVTSTAQKKAKIVLYDKYGKEVADSYLEYSPSEIEASIPIIKRVEEPIKIRFKHGYFNENNVDIEMSSRSITVTGDPVIVNKGDFFDAIEIDEKSAFDENGVCELKVHFDPPNGLTFSEDSIDIKIIRSADIKTRKITLSEENIIESGASSDVEYIIHKSPIVVTLMGPIEALANIKPSDVTLWLDMSPYDDSNKGTVKMRAKVVIDSTSSSAVLEVGYYDVNVTFID